MEVGFWRWEKFVIFCENGKQVWTNNLQVFTQFLHQQLDAALYLSFCVCLVFGISLFYFRLGKYSNH